MQVYVPKLVRFVRLSCDSVPVIPGVLRFQALGTIEGWSRVQGPLIKGVFIGLTRLQIAEYD